LFPVLNDEGRFRSFHDGIVAFFDYPQNRTTTGRMLWQKNFAEAIPLRATYDDLFLHHHINHLRNINIIFAFSQDFY